MLGMSEGIGMVYRGYSLLRTSKLFYLHFALLGP